MQLAVVAVGPPVSAGDPVELVCGRLKAAPWHAVHAPEAFGPVARRLAGTLGIDTEVADGVSVATLIERNAGKQLVLLCDLEATRTLVAESLHVTGATLAAPQPFSLTIIIAGRSGKRSVARYNDTLHLVLAAEGPGRTP